MLKDEEQMKGASVLLAIVADILYVLVVFWRFGRFLISSLFKSQSNGDRRRLGAFLFGALLSIVVLLAIAMFIVRLRRIPAVLQEKSSHVLSIVDRQSVTDRVKTGRRGSG
jgi:hypothetical protein